jgi:hypothetical protein
MEREVMNKIKTITNSLRQLERGQTLVLLVLALFALLAIMALVIDGGMAYAQRRAAQNAADAGALAGARELCEGNGETAAVNRAEEYAIARNEALSIDPVVNGQKISVTAHITYDTFLASLLGQNEMTVSATASAGCYTPCGGDGMLPVAWACSPPEVGGEEEEEGDGESTGSGYNCAVQFGDLDDPVNSPKYIIMNSASNTEDWYCRDPGTGACIDPYTDLPRDPDDCINCDFDGDGVNDVLGTSTRGWLDLNGGGGGANEQKDWIYNGYHDPNFPIKQYLWVSGESGTQGSVFAEVAKIVEEKRHIVVLPIFDKICDGNPQIQSGCEWDSNTDDIYYANPSNPNQKAWYYRLADFSYFVITCVSEGHNKNTHLDGSSKNTMCPVKDQAQKDNPDMTKSQCQTDPNADNCPSRIPDNLETIEGYFIKGYVPGMEGACEGPGGGVYTIYLDN